jgi:glyoxylase-like metal-dependent hydrolase (beta-lactamase superfamily II)
MHRLVDLGGGVTVTAVTDAVAHHRRPIEECFPGQPTGGWDAVKRAYPETFGAERRWRLPVHTFLIRAPGITLLVDAGVGCARTPAAEAFQVVGDLPDHLARLGVKPGAVDAVVFTHLHQDHVGWAADPETGEPTFLNARYLVHRREWEANHADGRTPGWIGQSLEPLMARSRVELIELGELADGIEVVGLPGHTAGHCGLVVSGLEARAVLVGDAFNHPQQVAQPELPSIADADRRRATGTRREILERARSGEWPLLAGAHLPGAWWVPASDGHGLVWQAAG